MNGVTLLVQARPQGDRSIAVLRYTCTYMYVHVHCPLCVQLSVRCVCVCMGDSEFVFAVLFITLMS